MSLLEKFLLLGAPTVKISTFLTNDKITRIVSHKHIFIPQDTKVNQYLPLKRKFLTDTILPGQKNNCAHNF